MPDPATPGGGSDDWRLQVAEFLLSSPGPDAPSIGEIDEILRQLLVDCFSGSPPDQDVTQGATSVTLPGDLMTIPGVLRGAAPDLSLLVSLYESFLARPLILDGNGTPCLQGGLRRNRGAYYTPAPVVEYIIDEALSAVTATGIIPPREMTILDPACGCGAFLVQACRALEKPDLRDQAVQPSEEGCAPGRMKEDSPAQISRFYGIDLDPLAVRIARMVLGARAAGGTGAAHIRTGNALIERSIPGTRWQDLRPFCWQDEFPEAMSSGGFAVIVGNPPWASYGLRGAQKLPKEVDAYLRNRYPRSAEYKLNSASLFIDKSLELLREGGICGFIVPDSLLLGRYASKIRCRILESAVIRNIVLIREGFWQGATPGSSAILILQKERDPEIRSSHEVSAVFCPSLRALAARELREYRYPQRYFETLRYNRFRLIFDREAMTFIRRMEAGSVPLGTLASPHTGVRSRIGRERILSRWWKGSSWKPGIVSGREVACYRLRPTGMYIDITPSRLWAGGWDREIVRNEKLILRQTGDRLIAAFDAQGYYHMNNCHSLSLKGDRVPLKFLCAILNSRAMNCYYQLISLERGRPLAQVDMDMLEELPIRLSPHRLVSALVEETDTILANRPGGPGIPRADRDEEIADAAVQALVNRLYRVSDRTISHIMKVWE